MSSLPEREVWNHNIHYHPLILRAIPRGCARALDVGCGSGLLACKLAERCGEVVAIDADRDILAKAPASTGTVSYIQGDAMTHPFAASSFDLVTAVASLHHLPLPQALARFKHLLRPGGVLAVIGLYRNHSPVDYAFASAAIPVSWIRRWGRPQYVTGATVRDPATTLREIRAACNQVLPKAVLRRRLYFRYSLTWRKP